MKVINGYVRCYIESVAFPFLTFLEHVNDHAGLSDSCALLACELFMDNAWTELLDWVVQHDLIDDGTYEMQIFVQAPDGNWYNICAEELPEDHPMTIEGYARVVN